MKMNNFSSLIIAGMFVCAFLGLPVRGVTLFVDEFDDPLLGKWNVEENANGSIAATGGRLHIDASDTGADTSWGSFGLISSSFFTRKPAGEGNLYLYFWGVEQNSAPTYIYLGVTDSAVRPQADTDYECAVYARAHTSPDADIQEVFVLPPAGGAGNWALDGSVGGPLLQPDPPTGILYDYRIVLKDQGVTNGMTEMNLEYKLLADTVWNDFVNTADPISELLFPAPGAFLYIGIMPRDHATWGTDVFVDAVQVTDQDLTSFAVIPTAAPISGAEVGDSLGVTFQSSNGVNYSLESGPDTNNFSATPLLIQGDGNSLTVFDPGGPDTGMVYRITEVP